MDSDIMSDCDLDHWLDLDERTYKILCMADARGGDPQIGLQKIVDIYLSLVGPQDLHRFQFEVAKNKAKELNLLD